MINFTVGFVVFANRYIKPCFAEKACRSPGIHKELIDLMNYQINQKNLNLILQHFPKYEDNGSNHTGLFDSLQSGITPLSVPWFSMDYKRFQHYDFLLPPLMGSLHPQFYIHNHSVRLNIQLYRLLSWQICACIIILDIIICAYLMHSRRERATTRTYMHRWKPISIPNAIKIVTDLSFQQRSRKLWVEWKEKMIVLLWSVCMSMVIMRVVKAGYTSSMTVPKYPTAHTWKEAAYLLQHRNFKLLLWPPPTNMHRIIMNDDDTAVLRDTFTDKNCVLMKHEKLEAYLTQTVGTMMIQNDFSRQIAVDNDQINMFKLKRMTAEFVSMMISRAKFKHRKLLKTALQYGAQHMEEFGYIYMIKQKYMGRKPTNIKRLERVPIQLSHISVATKTLLVGYGIASLMLMTERIMRWTMIETHYLLRQ